MFLFAAERHVRRGQSHPGERRNADQPSALVAGVAAKCGNLSARRGHFARILAVPSLLCPSRSALDRLTPIPLPAVVRRACGARSRWSSAPLVCGRLRCRLPLPAAGTLGSPAVPAVSAAPAVVELAAGAPGVRAGASPGVPALLAAAPLPAVPAAAASPAPSWAWVYQGPALLTVARVLRLAAGLCVACLAAHPRGVCASSTAALLFLAWGFGVAFRHRKPSCSWRGQACQGMPQLHFHLLVLATLPHWGQRRLAHPPLWTRLLPAACLTVLQVGQAIL